MSRCVLIVDSATGALIDVAGNSREGGRYKKFVGRILSLDQNPNLDYGVNGGDTLIVSNGGYNGKEIILKAKKVTISGDLKVNGNTVSGDDGKLDSASAYPAWDEETIYHVGTSVSYKGEIWTCISEGPANMPPDAEDGASIWGYSSKTIDELKQDALSDQQLANIAAVPNKVGKSDVQYKDAISTVEEYYVAEFAKDALIGTTSSFFRSGTYAFSGDGGVFVRKTVVITVDGVRQDDLKLVVEPAYNVVEAGNARVFLGNPTVSLENPEQPFMTVGTTPLYMAFNIAGDGAVAPVVLTDLEDGSTILAIVPSGEPYFNMDFDFTVEGRRVKMRVADKFEVLLSPSEYIEKIAQYSLAPLDSPNLTGTPTAPTAAAGTNTTQIATTAFVAGSLPYSLVVAQQTGDWQFSWRYSSHWNNFRLSYENGAWVASLVDPDGDYIYSVYSQPSETSEYAAELTFVVLDDGLTERTVTATRAWALQDRAGNKVTMDSSATLQLPPAVAGKMRDLAVRLTLVADAYDNVPSPAFDASVDWETEGGVNFDFSAAGTYILRMTETAEAIPASGNNAAVPAKFFAQCKQVATMGSAT